MSTEINPGNCAHDYEQAQCNYFDQARCHSCDLLAIQKGARLRHKISKIMEHLTSHGITPGVIEPIVLGQHPWGGRRKIKMAVSGTPQQPSLGIVRRDLTSEDLSECPLMPPVFHSLCKSLRALIREHGLTPYNIQERRGELKHIILLSNADTSQGILRFILRSTDLVTNIRRIVGALQDLFPWIRVITCNIQPKHAAILEGPEEICLTVEREIRECLGEIPLYLTPKSFMQVTPEIAQKLYSRAQECAQRYAPRRVLDLFCGVGGFALHTAQNASSLIGVEVSPSAIASATRSAGEMGLRNTSFISSDVDEFLRGYAESPPDLIIVNPPRRGLSEEAVTHITNLSPQRILYSSCSPESFARDAKRLSGYTLERLTPFDMFPMTSHCEVLGEFRGIRHL